MVSIDIAVLISWQVDIELLISWQIDIAFIDILAG